MDENGVAQNNVTITYICVLGVSSLKSIGKVMNAWLWYQVQLLSVESIIQAVLCLMKVPWANLVFSKGGGEVVIQLSTGCVMPSKFILLHSKCWETWRINNGTCHTDVFNTRLQILQLCWEKKVRWFCSSDQRSDALIPWHGICCHYRNLITILKKRYSSDVDWTCTQWCAQSCG